MKKGNETNEAKEIHLENWKTQQPWKHITDISYYTSLKANFMQYFFRSQANVAYRPESTNSSQSPVRAARADYVASDGQVILSLSPNDQW